MTYSPELFQARRRGYQTSESKISEMARRSVRKRSRRPPRRGGQRA